MFVKEIIVSEERKRNHNMCTAIFSTLTCKVMSAIHHPFILPVRFLSSTEMGGENSAEELFLIMSLTVMVSSVTLSYIYTRVSQVFWELASATIPLANSGS